MRTSPDHLCFRQRAASYVLRTSPGGVEVLVVLHRDHPEAGVQVPGGGAKEGETVGAAAVREAAEETGAAGLALGEVLGSRLLKVTAGEHDFQVSTYSWLSTIETRARWDHEVAGHDDDRGLRFRCEFRPVSDAGIDWNLDCLLDMAVERFTARFAAAR